KSIDAAYSAARSSNGLEGGYEIVLRPGDYPQSIFLDQINAEASQQFPVVVRAEVPGTAVLHGFLTASGSHVYLIGLTFAGTPAGGGAVAVGNFDYVLLRDIHADGAINVTTGTHAYLENVTVNTGWGGVFVSYVQYGHIIDSRVSSDLNPCVEVAGGSAYFLVDSNDVGPCKNGGAIQIGSVTSLDRHTSPWIHYDAYDVKVTNNLLQDPGVFTFFADGVYNVLFAHNTIVSSTNTVFVAAALGDRTCDNTSICQTFHDAGGWGPAAVEAPVASVPNRNVTVAANIFDEPNATPQAVIVRAEPPDTSGSTSATNVPSPAKSDDNLSIRGNIIWAPSAQLLAGGAGACDSSNPTCNASQLASDNQFNVINPQLQSNERPVANGDLFGLAALTIAPFTWSDAPTKPAVPQGELVNSVTTDADDVARTGYVPGAFTKSVAPGRDRAVKH
ncbi:MAG TPA: hypothetical protein VL284_02065, partial [Thermoanaerobaculia bacterium]|nr:hypothetical protein [Thermoanaerobaculia bacterium]